MGTAATIQQHNVKKQFGKPISIEDGVGLERASSSDPYRIDSKRAVLEEQGDDTMKIGFIGAGKAGTSLGIHFVKHGIPVAGYYSRTKESTCKAAGLTKSAAFSSAEALCTACDVLFITTPDGTIAKVAEDLAHRGIRPPYVCHCSGSLSSQILQPMETQAGSAHPMLAIAGRETDLSGAFFTLEGTDAAAELLQDLLGRCGNPTARIASESKPRYHCAASVASNLMIGLGAISMDLLQDCGFSQAQARELLTPLVKNNAAALCEKGPAAALTGPVERGDAETVRMHLAALTGEAREIYRLLSLELIKVAQEKNKDRSYHALKTMLEEAK
jgi:predicted short-subunit dehydrogenase-like oxidoreductase (DUF2520 family)